VRREVAPPKPARPQGEETQQPVKRGRKVTPQPDEPKDKKNSKEKKKPN
jgi:hypothetical protein